MKLHSYPSVFSLGHRAIRDLFLSEVIVEEKIDGSQISWGIIDGELVIRSKNREIIVDAPDKMFERAVDIIKLIVSSLTPGYHYRGEYLQKPKHNCLTYGRIPAGNIILFDIDDGLGGFLSREEKEKEAKRIGLEVVPILFKGTIQDVGEFRQFLTLESILGGVVLEGVVIKPANYDLFGQDKKVLMGKFVREEFKELNGVNWKKENPGKKDVIAAIGDELKSEARWRKAIIHLKERGLLEDSPKDIGVLIKEVPQDILKEHEDEIKDKLFSWAWPQIKRIATHGLPEWYKQELLNLQFEESEEANNFYQKFSD